MSTPMMTDIDTDGHHREPDLPEDEAAEQSVLGAMMESQEAIAVADVIETGLTGEHFYRGRHRVIYDQILEMYGDGKPIDTVAVAHELGENVLVKIGGAPYLHTLIRTIPTATNASYYAEIVRKKAIKRSLVEAGTRITQLGYHGDDANEITTLINHAQTTLDGVGDDSASEECETPGQLMQVTLTDLQAIEDNGGPADGIPTGFVDLDELTTGLHPGQMVILAGRPGAGKSTLGLDCARSAVKNGCTSAIFSLEMGKSEIMLRMLSAEARVRLSDMRGGRMTSEDWDRVMRKASEIEQAPLFIDDSPGLTMPAIRAKARRLKQRHDLKLIVVDYLQLMSSGKRVESRQQEVSEFSRNIKLLGKELEVPVIAISQLNRGPEDRSDKRPQLSDLRESGSLEQDSDLVILVHRPDAYERDHPRMGEADLILAKHRSGPTSTVTVAHQLHYSRFVDMAQE